MPGRAEKHPMPFFSFFYFFCLVVVRPTQPATLCLASGKLAAGWEGAFTPSSVSSF